MRARKVDCIIEEWEFICCHCFARLLYLDLREVEIPLLIKSYANKRLWKLVKTNKQSFNQANSKIRFNINFISGWYSLYGN